VLTYEPSNQFEDRVEINDERLSPVTGWFTTAQRAAGLLTPKAGL
jgi:hypothetical protein